MPEWIKSYLRQLNSTIIQELTDAEFGLWNKFLLLAGAQDPIGGTFKITDMEGFAGNIHSDEESIVKTWKKLKNTKRIKVKEISEGLLVVICNWHKYQSFTRDKVDSHKAPKNRKADSRFLHREEKSREEKKREEEEENLSISSSSPSLKNSEEKNNAPAIIPEQYLKLVALFAEEWKAAHPDLQTSPSQKMTDAEVFRSMIEEDRIDLALIESVIKSWRHNQFWGRALTGAEHFRKKFQPLIQARDEDLRKGLLGIDEYVKWALNDKAEFSRVCDKKPKDRNEAEEALLEEFERKHPRR